MHTQSRPATWFRHYRDYRAEGPAGIDVGCPLICCRRLNLNGNRQIWSLNPPARAINSQTKLRSIPSLTCFSNDDASLVLCSLAGSGLFRTTTSRSSEYRSRQLFAFLFRFYKLPCRQVMHALMR